MRTLRTAIFIIRREFRCTARLVHRNCLLGPYSSKHVLINCLLNYFRDWFDSFRDRMSKSLFQTYEIEELPNCAIFAGVWKFLRFVAVRQCADLQFSTRIDGQVRHA